MQKNKSVCSVHGVVINTERIINLTAKGIESFFGSKKKLKLDQFDAKFTYCSGFDLFRFN